jgi:hypothetical protein
MCKLETLDEAVAKLLEFAEYPKARAYDAHSCQVAKEGTLELAYQIVGDRRRTKSLKLPGFASNFADWLSLGAKWLSCSKHGPLTEVRSSEAIPAERAYLLVSALPT